MTQLLTRTAIVALVAGLAGACATTPAYPTVEGVTPGTGPRIPERPTYATTRADPGPADGEAYDEQGDPATNAAPTTPVESESLTPVRPVGAVQVAQLAPPPVSDAAPPAAGEEEAVAETREEAPPPAPAAAAPPPPPATRVVTLAPGKVVDIDGRPKTYRVKEGQGLDAVARAMGSTRAELAKINGLKEPYRLKPGQTIKGPASRAKAYVVAPGDTLFAIAQRFKVTAAALADENDIELSAPIRAGQKLRLPPGYKDGGPIRKTVTVTPEPAGPAAPPPVVVAPPRPQPQPAAPTTQTPPVVAPPAARPPVAKPPVTTPSKPPATTPPATTAPKPAAPATRPPAATPVPPKPLPPAPTVVPADRPPSLSDEQIAGLGAGRFSWPVTGQVLSDFGPKPGGQRNDGLNIGAAAGTPVRAASGGKVVYSGGDVPGFGVTVLIQHPDGWVTVYGHLARADVRMQQTVQAGDVIGQVGTSGGVSQPQLHFEIRYSPSPKFKAKAIDPALVLPRR